MFSAPLRRRLSRLLAVLAGFALCLTPIGVFARYQAEQALTPAVAAPSPLDQEADPAALYRTASARLAALGLDQEATDILWGRVGPELSAQLEAGTLSQQDLEYLLLPCCRTELLERYRAYAQNAPGLSIEDVVTQVNIGLDSDFYSGIQEIGDPASPTVLVNKYHALPQDYVPALTPLDPKYGVGSLTPEAAAAFVRMADAAQLEGISLRSVSAYRSYRTQASLYNRYLSQSGREQADTFSARPGHSEHQTGLALDINVAQTSAHFQDTPEFAWLQANCAQYGFLLRYPADKQWITGYRFEPWHYRYVGTEIAQICMEQDLTYEEYLAQQPVPGDYQAPALSYEGADLDLDGGALLLEDIPYFSAAPLASLLGWSVEQSGSRLALSNGQYTLSLAPGWRCQRDGLSCRLSAPALSLNGGLYLSLPDLCRLLELNSAQTETGVALTASLTSLSKLL